METTKVVINKCYGGFGLSYAATVEYARRKGLNVQLYQRKNGEFRGPWEKVEADAGDSILLGSYFTDVPVDDASNDNIHFSVYDIPRDDPDLVAVVESLGEKAEGNYAELKIVEIPVDVEFVIEEYDGMEWVAEKHRTWR